MKWWCRVSALALLSCCALLHAASDFKIGPDNPLDSLALSAGTDNWLVVWRDLRNSAAPRIAGALVSKGGIVGTDFFISDAAGTPTEGPVQRATVAWDGTNFLTVWFDSRTAANGGGVRGAFVSPLGTVAPDFLISSTTRTTNVAPLLAYNGTDYVVGWQDDAFSGGGTQVFFARVSKIGAVGARQTLPDAGATPDQALELLVAGSGSEVLLTYQDLSGTVALTRGTRIVGDNTFAGPREGAFLFRKDFSATGFGAPLAAAFDGTDYVILSSHGAQMDSTVFKTRLLTDGTVLRTSISFAEVGQGTTGLAEDNFPRAFYDGGDEFLFVRNSKVSDIAYHLLTKRVKLDGTDRDPNLPLIDTASQGVLNGAQAAKLGDKYLVLWMDGRRSGFQPARQENIYGFLLDATLPGDIVQGYVRATARVVPTIGSAPLHAFFGPGASTGFIDSLRWDFGDGATDDLGTTEHTYETKGTYIAVLNLIRAGFIVRDFARVLVDVDELGGGGGPAQSVGGSLGPLSPGVEPDVFFTQLSVTRQLSKSGIDALRIFGWFDPANLPVTTKDRTGSLTILDRTYSFTTDASGVFNSPAGTLPFVRFALNRFTGAFALTASNDDFTAAFTALGVGTDTVAKPGVDIDVPYTLTYDTLRQESVATGNYQATAAKSGRLTYFFSPIGAIGSGYMHLFSTKANETGEKGARTHKFTIVGNSGPGGGVELEKALSGRWRITLGNFTEDIPVSALIDSGGVYSFKGAKGKTGITAFFYHRANGNFGVALKDVPAEGTAPSGMPLATSSIFRADMALSLDFDTTTGAFQSSAFARFGRSKAGSGKWKIR